MVALRQMRTIPGMVQSPPVQPADALPATAVAWQRGADVPVAKLRAPLPPRALVPRRSLLDRLADGGHVRLITVCGPAGFGKTTAMLQIRDRLWAQGVATAWLTLDRADNDGARFLRSLGSAVAQLGPPPTEAATPLGALASLAASGKPFALFLDDVELIEDPGVISILRAAIEGLTQGGRMVVGARSLPDLGLARLRVHGRLLELDATSLRFTLDETRAYLQARLGAAPSADGLSRLHRRTEGWIAALWLASAALEQPGADSGLIERFSGSDRALTDYLANDVLVHQTADVRAFLLRTSILQDLNPSVCQVLVPEVDAARMLETLAEKNLFLQPMDGDEHRYRYNGLFADYLRRRLLQEHPAAVPALHLCASQWFEANRLPVTAIEHAIDGGHVERALDLLEQQAQRLLELGRMRLLERWFATLPPTALQGRPVLQAVSVWATTLTRGAIEGAQALANSGCAAQPDPRVQAHVNALEALLPAMQDCFDDAGAKGTPNLQRLPTGNHFADGVLRTVMAHVFSVLGNPQASQRLLDDARRAQGDSGFNRMYAESEDGQLDLLSGRLRLATARFRSALGATMAQALDYTSGSAWAGILYASALYEANEIDAAARLVDVYLPLACDIGLPGHMIDGHLIRARIAFRRGDVDKAFDALIALEFLGQRRRLPRVMASAKLERGRLLLLQGHAQAAREELDRADEPGLWEQVRGWRLSTHDMDDLALGRLRWQAHFGDARATLAPLEAELAQASAQGRQRRVLRIRVLQSIALQHSGEAAAATETLATALRQACQEGFVRVIADEGAAVARILHGYHATLQAIPARHVDSAILKYLERLLGIVGPVIELDVPTGDDQLLQPLTRKEIQVLQLGAEGHSNASLAEKLGLSDSTVRTHLRSINAKLRARSRSEAIAIGRRIGVVR